MKNILVGLGLLAATAFSACEKKEDPKPEEKTDITQFIELGTNRRFLDVKHTGAQKLYGIFTPSTNTQPPIPGLTQGSPFLLSPATGQVGNGMTARIFFTASVAGRAIVFVLDSNDNRILDNQDQQYIVTFN